MTEFIIVLDIVIIISFLTRRKELDLGLAAQYQNVLKEPYVAEDMWYRKDYEGWMLFIRLNNHR